MTLEYRIQAILNDDSYRISISSGFGFGAVKYDLYQEGQRGVILTEKTAQELTDWAIAKVAPKTAAPACQTYEIDLVHSMREEMVIDTIFNAKWLPRQGDTITTERGKYQVTKVDHNYQFERIYISVIEVNQYGVGR